MLKRNALILLTISAIITACSQLSSFEKHDLDAANVHLQLGQHYLAMNMLDIAKENLELALKEDSSNVPAHNTLAVLYNRIGQPENAKEEFEKALSLSNEDFGVLNNYGQFLCEHKELQRGLELLTKAAFNPLNRQAWLALTNAGYCQINAQNKSEAENYFKQALQVNENYAPALLALQKMSFQRNEFWAAKGYWQRSLQLGEQNPESLFIAIQTEKALGSEELAKEYQRLLIEKFPLSEEVKKLNN